MGRTTRHRQSQYDCASYATANSALWRSRDREGIVSGHLVVARMSIFTSRFGFALVLALLCLGGRPAHTQSAPVQYWTPGWPMGLGGGSADQNSDAYGNFPSFDFRDVGNGSSYARYNFSNGFFVGSQRSGMGFSSLGQSSFNNFG